MSVEIELLDPLVSRVGDVDVTKTIRGDPQWVFKTSKARSWTSLTEDQYAGGELVHALCSILKHVDVSKCVGRNGDWLEELSTEPTEIVTLAVEDLDSTVGGVCHVDVARTVHGDVVRKLELPVARTTG